MRKNIFTVKYAANDCKVKRNWKIKLNDFDPEEITASRACIINAGKVVADLELVVLPSGSAPLALHYFEGTAVIGSSTDLLKFIFTPLPDDSGKYKFLVGSVKPVLPQEEEESDMFGAEEGGN